MTRSSSGNVYVPFGGKVEVVIPQARDISLFRVKTEAPLDYAPGQFFMVSLWGAGEVPISVASLSRDDAVVDLCIRRAGAVTGALHALEAGDTVWLRGPYGNGFPLDTSRGRDVVLVAGGIGLAPLRPLIEWFMENPGDAGRVTLLYGAKSPGEIVFRDEMEQWRDRGIEVLVTVDRAEGGWEGRTGLVTGLWQELRSDLQQATAYICGPEVMIRAAMGELFLLGMPEERIITTLEAHMKCGVGKCGHCYAGPRYICTDGPVFSYREVKSYGLFLSR
ncbi:MAG: hydrogenase [Nitrospirae bacterium]|nr:hydrogenase [Nitrospirota bacterium]